MATFSKRSSLKHEIPDEEQPEIMTAEVDPHTMTGISERENSETELPIDMSVWTPEELQAYNNLRSKRKKCCIGGCTHRSLPIARSYHQLPVRNKEVWAKWVEVIRWSRNEPEWSPNGDASPLVCSRHFPDTEFISYEASSRVRLSHTAIPMHYVDPPEGTVMDPRFANPLPIPPILIGNGKNKDGGKGNKSKVANEMISELYKNTSHEDYDNESVQYVNNLDYDIEEVNDQESYDSMDMGYHQDGMNSYEQGQQEVTKNLQPYHDFDAQQQQAINYSVESGRSISSGNRGNMRLSAPPTLIHHKTQKAANLPKSKPPALIRTNFLSQYSLPTSPPLNHQIKNGGNKKSLSLLRKDFNHQQPNIPIPMVRSQPQSQTKHKIGLAKCKLIVQTLENQLKIAKMRLAEQLDIPYQVVQGVWNMKDSLKEKLNEK